MTFDWTVSVANILTVIGFFGAGLFAIMALKNQVTLLEQRLLQAQEDLQELSALQSLISEMRVKLDTMWEFSMRRAKGEAVISGLAAVNSPVKINDQARTLIAALAAPLQALYASLPVPEISDEELALEIERKFGERILHEVCIPNKLSLGACLLIAVQVARDNVGTEELEQTATDGVVGFGG